MHPAKPNNSINSSGFHQHRSNYHFFDNKDVTVIGAVLRCGRGSSYIDNHSAGGITALVDIATGKVCSCGSSKKKLNLFFHPDTGVILPGFQISHWEMAIATVMEAASSLRGIHYVGWDVAFTSAGICLIEANPSGDPVVLQETTQRGVKPLYDWMLSQL